MSTNCIKIHAAFSAQPCELSLCDSRYCMCTAVIYILHLTNHINKCYLDLSDQGQNLLLTSRCQFGRECLPQYGKTFVPPSHIDKKTKNVHCVWKLTSSGFALYLVVCEEQRPPNKYYNNANWIPNQLESSSTVRNLSVAGLRTSTQTSLQQRNPQGEKSTRPGGTGQIDANISGLTWAQQKKTEPEPPTRNPREQVHENKLISVIPLCTGDSIPTHESVCGFHVDLVKVLLVPDIVWLLFLREKLIEVKRYIGVESCNLTQHNVQSNEKTE